VAHVVEGCLPEGILLVFVFEGYGISDVVQEVLVGDGEADFAAMLFEVAAQAFGNRENGLFPGWFVRLATCGAVGLFGEMHHGPNVGLST
jgi:hypothetical protein